MKKIFTLFAAVMMAATMFAGRTFSADEALYLNAGAVGWWQDGNAVQVATFNDGTENHKVVGEALADDPKFVKFLVPAGTYETVIFSRHETAEADPWNATGAIALDGTDEYDLVKTFNQNSSDVTWGNYGDAPDPDVTYYLYVTDNCADWELLYVYAWGGKEVFGAWPGANVREAEKVDGKYKLAMTGQENIELHLIFNNNAGAQYDSDVIKLTADHNVTAAVPSAIENIEVAEKAVKVVENGQLIILKNGVRFNTLGTAL